MGSTTAGWGLVALAAWGSVGNPIAAAPTIHVEQRQRLTLEVRPLTAATVEGGPAFHLDVSEDTTAALRMQVLWPDPRRPRLLTLKATRRMTAGGEQVRLDAELLDPDGPPTLASREIPLASGSGTMLFEVARTRDGVLTLAVQSELTPETTFSARPVVGRPVEFELEIRWIEEGESVSLETNRLNTFLGQPVSYAFRLGEVGEAESVSLQLLPSRILGDAVRIEVEVGGTLPDGEDAVAVVGRREEWLATRGTTSVLSLASGEPPTGFQFLVTPRF